jgi:CRISPR-associated protein Cmr1
MILQNYSLEVITPCFCGGAEPDQRAEIRPASIRGQLRWWFRLLGGFKSLAHQSVEDQETMIFGATAGDAGTAGMLSVRVKNIKLMTSRKDSEALGHRPFTAPAFLTFPLQSTRNMDGTRGVVDSGTFTLQFLWRGNPALKGDLAALATVFGNLGSLGFRSRRAMGALAWAGENITPLADALACFNQAQAIYIRKFNANSSIDAISKLGGWLKSCRAHGRSGQNQMEQQSPYFQYAKHDHDLAAKREDGTGYRAALGLPILTKYGNWNATSKGGRFASPVILRPHKDANGKWHALVIFVDAKKWPQGQQVYLNGQPRAVSLDLYDAMKNDPSLQPFP